MESRDRNILVKKQVLNELLSAKLTSHPSHLVGRTSGCNPVPICLPSGTFRANRRRIEQPNMQATIRYTVDRAFTINEHWWD